MHSGQGRNRGTRVCFFAAAPLQQSYELKLSEMAHNSRSDYGANWRKLRKAIVTDLLHKSEFMKHSSHVMTQLMRAKTAIKERCTSNGGKAVLSPTRYVRSTTLNVIYSIVFGMTLEPGNPESNPELHELDKAMQGNFEELGVGAIEDFVPLLHVGILLQPI